MKYLVLSLILSFKLFGQQGESLLVDYLTEKNNEQIGRPYPAFSVKNETGKISNEQLIGKVVYVNFWTEYCPPCLAEMEALNALYEKYKDNNQFVFISFARDNLSVIDKIKNKFNIKYTIYSISIEECRRLNLNNGFPTSIVIDPDGKIGYIGFGGSSDKTKASELVVNEIEPEIIKALKKCR